MWVKQIVVPAFLSVLAIGIAVPTVAQQQVTISSPHTAVSDSFFEHTGTSWGVRGPNWFFQFGPPGNPNAAAPQFGGYNPSAGANFGFGFGGGGFGGGFLGNFSQGSRRSFTSVTPSVTVPNGGTGMIMDTSVSPFVMGFVPVVGGYPMAVAPSPVQPVMPPAAYIPPGPVSGHPGVLQALQNVGRENPQTEDKPARTQEPGALNVVGPAQANVEEVAADPADGRLRAAHQSSAGRPAMGVAEARRLHEAETAQKDVEARRLLERGRHAVEAGNPGLATTYYKMAANRASEGLRKEILKQLAALPTSQEQAH